MGRFKPATPQARAMSPGPVPRIGLGTSQVSDREECIRAIEVALEAGYRHVDTAQMYGNEDIVGEGLAAADVPREEVFVATKVDPGNLAYDDVLRTTEESLERLGLDYVDLLYVHWPIDTYDPAETLPAFDVLYDEAKTRHVGVSNFTVELLEEARGILDAPVVANQIQVHPMLPPDEGERATVIPYDDEHGIDTVAWSPLIRGEALGLPEVRAVAERRGVSPAQAVLAWLFGKGLKVIVKSVTPEYIRDNLAALDLELDDEDVAEIESVEGRKRLFDREQAPWNR